MMRSSDRLLMGIEYTDGRRASTLHDVLKTTISIAARGWRSPFVRRRIAVGVCAITGVQALVTAVSLAR